jgi:hypothetical protein
MARIKHVGSISEVIGAFCRHEPNPDKSHSVSQKNDILYSYSAPIARWVNGHLLYNVDRYSVTTSRHQSNVRSSENVPISFGCLNAHNVHVGERYADLSSLEVIDTTDGVYRETTSEHPAEFDAFENAITAEFGPIGEFHTQTWTDGVKHKTYHLTGSSLIRVDGKALWSSVDAGDYFVCQLPDPDVCSIQDAIYTLRPRPIRYRRDIIRQGEFFFVPTDAKPPVHLIEKWVRLSDLARQAWPIVTRVRNWRRDDVHIGHHTAQFAVSGRNAGERMIVSGTIRDRQHGKLVLPGGWFEVWHNTQIVSYSASQFGLRID